MVLRAEHKTRSPAHKRLPEDAPNTVISLTLLIPICTPFFQLCWLIPKPRTRARRHSTQANHINHLRMPSNSTNNDHIATSTNERASGSHNNGSANAIPGSSGKANKEPSFALRQWVADKDGPISEQLYQKYQAPVSSGNVGSGK